MPNHIVQREEQKIDYFFSHITNDSDPIIRAVNYLKARGFFIDYSNDNWVVSPENHENDVKYLAQIIEKYDIGTITGRILNFSGTNVDQLKNIFNNNRIAFEVVFMESGWLDFLYKQPRSIELRHLEVFVARYIRSLNLSGIFTNYSCDGNDHGHNRIEIGFDGIPSKLFHQLIWNEVLRGRYSLMWNRGVHEIRLSPFNKYLIYSELCKAADFFLINRIEIRGLKEIITRSIISNNVNYLDLDNEDTIAMMKSVLENDASAKQIISVL